MSVCLKDGGVVITAQLVAAFHLNARGVKHMLHVCTIPYKARLCGGSLGLLRSVLGSRCDPAANTSLHLVSQVDMRSASHVPNPMRL
jgi:hypothetical protein